MHEWVNWLKCEIILAFKALQDIQTKNDYVHFYMKILYPCESEFNIKQHKTFVHVKSLVAKFVVWHIFHGYKNTGKRCSVKFHIIKDKVLCRITYNK